MLPKLKGRPETKEIIFPVWRDDREHLFSLDDVLGAFACWAVRQSPYRVPDGLAEACAALAETLEPLWKESELGLRRMAGSYIEGALSEAFKFVPQIMAWNEPRSGHDRPFVACSRYDDPPPDDDIIALGALARNVKHTLLLERGYDDEGNPTADEPSPDSADRPTTS